jgi:steroid delta-isomerase-like uncharacterized protein
MKASVQEKNKELVRRWIEQLDARNLSVYDHLLADEAVVHFPGITMIRDQAVENEEIWYTAFPDTRHTIEDLIAEGDKVVLRHTVQGTHQSEFQGIQPSGRKITVTALLIYKIYDGKIVEIWAEADFAGLMNQLTASDSISSNYSDK